jgi:hypothetical protein
MLLGCAGQLIEVRLDPPPRSAGPLSITVPAVALSPELFAPRSGMVGADDRIRVDLEIENTSGVPVELALTDLTLVVEAHGGASFASAPVSGGDAKGPDRTDPPTGLAAGRLVLPAGARARVWASFGGLAGMPTTGAASARLRLRDPTGTREIPLATPGRAGPSWGRQRWYVGNYLQSGFDSGPRFSSFDTLALEGLLGRGGFFAGPGLGLSFGRTEAPDGYHYVPTISYGARAGWMSRAFGLGGLLGVDYRSGRELAPPQPAAGAPAPISIGATSVFAALRYNITPASPSPFGPFAINAPRSPLGHWAVEIGYVRWLAGGPLVEGGGLHLAFSASLVP